jgi:hypothetical protein
VELRALAFRVTSRAKLPLALTVPHPELGTISARALDVQRRLQEHDPNLFMSVDGPYDRKAKRIIPRRYTVWWSDGNGLPHRVGSFPFDRLDDIYLNVVQLDRTSPSHTREHGDVVDEHNERRQERATEEFGERAAEAIIKDYVDNHRRNIGHRYRFFIPLRERFRTSLERSRAQAR